MATVAILVMLPGFLYILAPSFYRSFILNLALIGQAVSEEKMFEYYHGNIHAFCPVLGQMNPCGVFQNH